MLIGHLITDADFVFNQIFKTNAGQHGAKLHKELVFGFRISISDFGGFMFI
jgi:hypothetical protein